MEFTPKILTDGPTSTSNHILDKKDVSSPPNPLTPFYPTSLLADPFIKLSYDTQMTVLKYLAIGDHISLSLTCKSNQKSYSSTVWPFRFILKDNKVVEGHITKGKTAHEIFDEQPLCRLPRLLLKDQKGIDAAMQALKSRRQCDSDTRDQILAEFQIKIAGLRAKDFNSEADAICYQLFDVAIELEVEVFEGCRAFREHELNLCHAKSIYASFGKENALDGITIEALIRENQISMTLFSWRMPRILNYIELPDFLQVATTAAETDGRKNAAYQLGEIYRVGNQELLNNWSKKIEPNQKEARKYFEIAAKQGHTMAIEALAKIPKEKTTIENCVIC